MSDAPGTGEEASDGADASAREAADRADRAAERAETAALTADRDVEEIEERISEAVLEAVEEKRDDYGTPGVPFSRRSPYFLGFVGALGALTAWYLFMAVVGIGSVLLLVVVSFFLAAGLDPAVRFLERRGLRRSLACASVMIAVLGALVLFVLAIVPVITDQVKAISDNVPGWIDQLQQSEKVQELNDEYQVLDKVQDYVADGDFITGLFGGVLGFGLRVLSTLFNAFIVIVLTLYFLASLNPTKDALYRLAPASRRDRVSRLGNQIIRNIGGYVAGAFLVALCAGLSSLAFLIIVGLGEYAVALAFVVALLDVIPMIGATIGAVVVCSIAAAVDLKTGVLCIIFYVAYQQIENYVIYPRVMSKSVNIPGQVTVIAALVGAGLLGVVGALLAIPTAAAILLVVKEVVVRRQDER